MEMNLKINGSAKTRFTAFVQFVWSFFPQKSLTNLKFIRYDRYYLLDLGMCTSVTLGSGVGSSMSRVRSSSSSATAAFLLLPGVRPLQ